MTAFRKHGIPPYRIVMLHGGPGAPGGMFQPASKLSAKKGILEPFQTRLSIKGQLDELYEVILEQCQTPVKVVGHSWGGWLGYLFAIYYPEITQKVILIGAGSFSAKYNDTIMNTRFNRLTEKEKKEARILSSLVMEGKASDFDFRRFGELMSKADSFDCFEDTKEEMKFYPEVYTAVWNEAEKMRNSGELLSLGQRITCPVVAIHGLDDPHRSAGVEIPLKKVLRDFRFIGLEKCGHYPWKERFAKDLFYELLDKELI
jgi:pimeloyl-ACP methyl ester carboxylesterase